MGIRRYPNLRYPKLTFPNRHSHLAFTSHVRCVRVFVPFFDYCVICDLQSGSPLIGSITGVKAPLTKTFNFYIIVSLIHQFTFSPSGFHIFHVDSDKFYKNHGYIIYVLFKASWVQYLNAFKIHLQRTRYTVSWRNNLKALWLKS